VSDFEQRGRESEILQAIAVVEGVCLYRDKGIGEGEEGEIGALEEAAVSDGGD
jgi:hypothetical protein